MEKWNEKLITDVGEIGKHELLWEFLSEYKRVDDEMEEYDGVEAYYEALDEGNDFIYNHTDFIEQFSKLLGRHFTNDFEVAAFAFALGKIGWDFGEGA